MRGVGMGDFEGAEPGPVEGRCRVCHAYIGPGSRYCYHHKHLRTKARAQVERLCEIAHRRKVRQMIADWWAATEPEEA